MKMMKNKLITNHLKNIDMKNQDTYLPIFPGFYNTIFEYNDEEQDIESYNEENETNLDFDDFLFDYADYNNRVAQCCCEFIEKELKSLNLISSLSFQELISPQFYNFENDSINIGIELTDENLKNIKKYLLDNIESFKTYLENNYTSGPGFISSFSTDVVNWIDDILHEHKLGSIFNFILLNEDDRVEEELYYYVSERENYIDFERVEQ